MIKSFLKQKSKTVAFAAFLLAVSALISRLLGLFRDNLLANLFTKSQTDIYFSAFRIPDLIYGILITGGIVAAFLPVFSSQYEKDSQRAKQLTNSVLTLFLILLVLFCSVFAFFAPQLVNLIVPGFNSYQKELTVDLTRIMFLSPVLLGLSAIFSGILQYFNLFLVYSLAPIFYNLGIIGGILFLSPIFGLRGLAFGVILGAFLHLIVQVLASFWCGFKPKFSFNFRRPGLKKIFKLMLPRTISSAAHHLNLIVITAIASTLTIGAIRVFNFANNLQGVALGLVGIPFATAVFPALSRHFAANKKKEYFKQFSSTFSHILYLILPLSILTFLLRAQIVRIILGTSILNGGLFDWWDTRLTAASLGIFSFSLFAASLVPFLARAFFSLHNTKTPVKIALFSMALNVVLSFYLVRVLASFSFFRNMLVSFLNLRGVENVSVLGLPLALSVSLVFQFLLLFLFLKKRIKEFNFGAILPSFSKIVVCSLLMGIFVYISIFSLSLFLKTNTAFGIFVQGAASALIGGAFYLLLTYFIGLSEPREIFFALKNQFKKAG